MKIKIKAETELQPNDYKGKKIGGERIGFFVNAFESEC